MKTAIINGQFLLFDEQCEPYLKSGTLIIDNDVIRSIAADVPANVLENCEIIDGRNKLYLPGLINTHTHIAMSPLRGFADDENLHSWFSKIWPIEAKYDNNAVKWSSLLSIAEMIRSGTTCFLDMYDRMAVIAKCVEETGVRASLCRGVIDFCSPQELEEKFNEVTEFSSTWHGKADNRISVMIAPHSINTVGPKTLEKLLKIADNFNLPFHTHLAETKQDVLEIRKKYNLSIMQYLFERGVLNHRCLLAHAVHVNEDDIDLIAEHNVHIAHNPSSNLKLASGIAPVTKFLEKGINVSLGTDSSASNNRLDMFMEMRTAALIHKGVANNPEIIPAKQALKMATINGARSLFLNDIGAISVGKKADLIAIDLDQPHFYPRTNLISSLVYSASGTDVTDVWVDGKLLMKNRQFTTIDIEKVIYEFNKVCNKILG